MTNFDEQVKYVFKRPYENEHGVIPEGTEIVLLRGFVYVNGGMGDEYSQGLIKSIVNNKQLRENYLTRMQIIGNKV